jgi:hypothetical protein
MAKKPGDPFSFQFTTSSPTTGALANADSLPTGKQVHNGVDDSTNAVTITNVSTGVYKATGTILGSYVSGDDFQVRINATVGGVSSGGLHDYGALDKFRISDVAVVGGVNVSAAGLDLVKTEGTVNARQTLALILDAVLSILSGVGTSQIIVKDPTGAHDRAVVDVDGSNNRTGVTFTPPA